jgi:O-antigen/teichoic acid export membrane protein
MSDKRLIRSASLVVVQVVVSGGVLFLLYSFLLKTVGAEQVGVWATVLAAASASRITEMGFTGSAVKYTAKYVARGDREQAAKVIETTVITIGIVLACVLAAGYPALEWFCKKLIPGEQLFILIEVLPFALISVWITSIAAVFLSGLDGCHRIDLRVIISVISATFLLLLTWIMVPAYGLTGLALAQLGQGCVMLFGSWFLLRRELAPLPIFPKKWDASLFREMYKYGVHFQVTSVVGMLFDPMTKVLMAKFGGLSATAFYDMASKMVQQFRFVIVASNQAMVPFVAELHENAPETIRKTYADAYRIIFLLSLPMYSGIIAIAPLVSELWIGHYEHSFVAYTVLLSAAYWLNTLIGPAYFVNLGTGRLRFNTLAHVVIGALNAVLGYGLGQALGADGVVLGYLIALLVGSSIVIVSFHLEQRISFLLLVPNGNSGYMMACGAGLTASWATFHLAEGTLGPLQQAALTAAVCLIPISIASWLHPIRTEIQRKFFS